MDVQGFERLSKQIAQAPSRRAMLGALGVGVAGAAGLALGRQAVAAAEVEPEAWGLCELPGKTCQDDTKCCSGKCRDGVCGCLKRGKYATVGFFCCSGKKKKGKCK